MKMGAGIETVVVVAAAAADDDDDDDNDAPTKTSANRHGLLACVIVQ